MSFGSEELALVDPRRWRERTRRWWARHPWLLDSIAATAYFVLAAVLITQVEVLSDLGDVVNVLAAAGTLFATTYAVLMRRRHTLGMSILVLALGVLSVFRAASIDVIAIPIMLYSLAVHRTSRLAVVFFALYAGAAFALPFLPWAPADAQADEFGAVLLLLSATFGLLLGIATRNRRDYVQSLMERAREREQLAVVTERTRIAREMHDIVSHTLSVVVTLSEGAARTKDETTARTAMSRVAEAGRGALDDLRGLLGALRDQGPAPLAPQPGARDLSELIRRFNDAGLPAQLTVGGQRAPQPSVELAVHRIIQEGLTNALRYSRDATRVTVVVKHQPEGTDIVVENDGAVANAASIGAGQGLRGLRERVELLGGTIASGPAGHAVWRLQAWIPRSTDQTGVGHD